MMGHYNLALERCTPQIILCEHTAVQICMLSTVGACFLVVVFSGIIVICKVSDNCRAEYLWENEIFQGWHSLRLRGMAYNYVVTSKILIWGSLFLFLAKNVDFFSGLSL